MPRCVCYHQGCYFEFSTVVDAPVSGLMTEEEFVEYYTKMYGEMAAESDHTDGMRARMERARKNGVSWKDDYYDGMGIEEYLKRNMATEFGTFNEETEDYDIDKWPGMDKFVEDYLGGYPDGVAPATLRDKVNPVDG